MASLIEVAKEVRQLRQQAEQHAAAAKQSAEARSAAEAHAVQRLQGELAAAVAETAAAKDQMEAAQAELLRVQRQVLQLCCIRPCIDLTVNTIWNWSRNACRWHGIMGLVQDTERTSHNAVHGCLHPAVSLWHIGLNCSDECRPGRCASCLVKQKGVSILPS